ncbi:MAG: hypothetical protein M3176_03895 [Chloroflexota bacterium]|nr:hypothetical protein [Chloroflexota bacterium]
MAFAITSRRTARTRPHWTVVPFDARGAGVGEIPPTVAIETPHDGETLLVLCVEAEQAGPDTVRRCSLALDAFRAGFATISPRMLTNALLAGMEEANGALYDQRAARGMHRPVGIGLTALVARGADAYIIQAGPGQALIVGAEGITALPPLHRHGSPGALDSDERAGAAPLGTLPTIEPDLFHVDASDGLFAALCVSALGRVLPREDDGPLLACNAANAGEYLVSLGTRYRLPQAYGVICSTMGGDDGVPAMPPARGIIGMAQPEASDDAVADPWSAGLPTAEEPTRHARYAPAPVPQGDEAEPRWEYLGEPERGRLRGWRAGAASSQDATWGDPHHAPRAGRLPALPPRLWVLIGGFLLALVLAVLIGIVHALSAHRANSATLHELDVIAVARAQAVALPDPQAHYAALTTVGVQLEKVAAEGRQTQRVAEERQQLTQALDTAASVTRVIPSPVAALPHFDGAPGSHRLVLAGDDGTLYLFERDKNDWGVYAVNPTTQKPDRLFATGAIANKVPAGDLRGLLWFNGPATTDRTRLFARTANGTWGERAIPALGEQRPTAIAALGDGLYLLDSGVGVIVRVPLADSTGAKPWTTDAASAELKTAVDMASDGQMLWVLLGDGRVRGFVGGAPAQLIATPAVPPVKEATAIAAPLNSPYLYVADGAQGRILRIRKADGQIVQALRAAEGAPPITRMQSLTVDERKGTLWYATADGIVTVPLPPVRGA